MVDDDSDEMLGARLDAALRSDLDVGPVDVATLLEGSRHRARRVRTRRIAAMTTAAVTVLAVPVGYEVMNPGSWSDSQPAAMLPSNSRSDADRPVAPADRPIPTAAPSALVPPSADSASARSSTGVSPATSAGSQTAPGPPGTPVPPSIPASFAAFPPAQLPDGVSLQSTDVNPAQMLVAGQECGPPGSGPALSVQAVRPVAGRQWLWAARTGEPSTRSISLTITGWAGVDSSIAFQQAVDGTGYCRWLVPQKPRTPTGDLGPESWASTSSSGDLHYARTLVRIGNGIVGVQVQDSRGVGPAAALADRLTKLQVDRLGQG